MFDHNGKEFKSIKIGADDKDPKRQGVCCIDYNESIRYLAIGCNNGNIVIHDMQKDCKIDIVKDKFKQIYSLKFLKKEKPTIIVSDSDGSVSLVEFSKGFLGIKEYTVQPLWSTSKADPCICINTYIPSVYIQLEIDSNMITALGYFSQVKILSINTHKLICEIKKWQKVKDYQLPYIDWGRGEVPMITQNKFPLLAVGWGRAVQIYTLEGSNADNAKVVERCFFEVDDEIVGLNFLADGTLLLFLKANKEIMIVLTSHFMEGSYNKQEQQSFDLNTKAVLHKYAYQMEDMEPRIIAEINARTYHSNTAKNYNRFSILTKKEVVVGQLQKWSDFLEKLKKNGNAMRSLACGLQLFQGKMKGFAEIYTDDEIREATLKGQLKTYLLDMLPLILQAKGTDDKTPILQYIIEFCVGIKSQEFLFKEVYDRILEYRIVEQFVGCLEQFIMNGKMKDEPIPQCILNALFDYYVGKKQLPKLEALILCLNLQKLDTNNFRETCIKNKMYTSYLYIMTVNSTNVQL